MRSSLSVPRSPFRPKWATLGAVFGLAGACFLSLTTESAADPIRFPGLTPALSPDFVKAVDLLRAGRLTEADSAFQHILDAHPDQVYAALGHAQVAVDENQLDQADSAVMLVLAKQPNMPEAHNMKGLVLTLRKQHDSARREFTRAIELEPKYVTPRLFLAAMSFDDKHYDQAIGEYQELTRVAPRFAAGYLGEAQALVMAGKAPEAYLALESWKKADPANGLPFEVIANLRIVNGDIPHAIDELKNGLTAHPDDVRLRAQLGSAYGALGDVRSAEAAYKAALVAEPTNAEALIGMGDLSARAGQTDQALTDYRAALKGDPNSAIAANNIAWLLADDGRQLDEALRLALLATKVDPTYVDAVDTLGWVYYRKGDFPSAVTTLRKAKAMAPTRLDVAGRLGLALAKTGSRVEAIAELKRALSAPPPVWNRADIEHALAELSGGRGTP
jgi:tetratricopeptide (TPR) repeat protein